jgi:hypothetical protein
MLALALRRAIQVLFSSKKTAEHAQENALGELKCQELEYSI